MDLSQLSNQELAQLLIQPTILNQICHGLNFEDAVQLRTSLKLKVLNCPIPIDDPKQKVTFLPWVDDSTIQLYQLIKERGSKRVLNLNVSGGNLENVKILLAGGADVNAASSLGETALTRAFTYNQWNIAKLLLDAGANVRKDALQSAVEYGKLEIVKILLDHGINIESKDIFGHTPLMLASRGDHLEIVRELLDRGANLQAVNNFGRTALMIASMYGRVKIVQELLNAATQQLPDPGVYINVQLPNGDTALIAAASKGFLEIVQILLENGADPQIIGENGLTALQIAERNGQTAVAKLIQEYPVQ